MNHQTTYDTLLSHNSRDKPAIEQLAVRLKAEGLSVWFDKWDLVPGEPWQKAIERALAASRSVAVFVGRDGLGPWHELEMRAALSQQVDARRGFRVIPVLLPEATIATSASLPAFLKQLTWVQFQDTLDDADAWQRLLAGIRGEAPGYVPAASGSQWIEDSGKPIVPRGLRAFDERDRAFYLRLLPGARDRHGLPESIGFWKDALEQIDAERTFRVGLIFGPSGSGKSSSVGAGLIPHLAEYVLAIHLDATPDATEQQLLQRLHKRLPGLPTDLDLPDTLGSLRQDASPLEGRKLVLILDQFEQWLHAHPVLEGQPLVKALEHCDGGRLQAVVMVRDEFFLAIDRFMDALNVPIRKGINMMLVDKFAPDHARRVLAEFGRAYGRIPDGQEPYTRDLNLFLDRATKLLADAADRVVSVQIALFADMLQDKPWTPQTLRPLGGFAGVGLDFLQENFDRPTANPDHRVHRRAAMGVLSALLPETGTDIKGRRRAQDDLLQIAGYERQPAKFARLLEILDSDLRIITPVQSAAGEDDTAGPEAVADPTAPLAPQPAAEDPPVPSVTDSGRFYQLTHDYLVPSLRQWVTLGEQETPDGRARLRLAERAALWNANPENQQLPACWEFLNILLRVGRNRWTAGQRKMMQAAGRFHGIRAAALLILLSLLGSSAYEIHGNLQAAALVNSLQTAKEDAVLGVIDQLAPYRRWADGRLRSLASAEVQTADDQRAVLHAQMALLAVEPGLAEALKERLLDAATPYSYVGLLRDVLRPYRERFTGQLWETLRAADLQPERRFHAGLALAEYEPASDGWREEDARFLAEQLVAANPEHQPRLREYLAPIGGSLLAPLEALFGDHELPESHQLGAANALADFAGQDAERLAGLLTTATGAQYRILYERFERLGASAANDRLVQLVQIEPPAELGSVERVSYGRRRAGAAITLLRQGQVDQMFAALRVGADPESLTQFVHRCRARDVSPQMLLDALDTADQLRRTKTGKARQQEDRVLFGLLLALGEYRLEELPASARQPMVDRLAAWYANDPSSAIHGATGWLLRHWNQGQLARQVDETPVPYSPEREWYTLAIPVDSEPDGEAAASIYFTFIVFPAGDYEIGSPEDEPEAMRDEPRRRVRLTRGFALSDRPVTWRQFDAFDGGSHRAAFSRQVGRELGDEDPVFGVNWFESVAYCRWLTTQSGLSESDQAYGPEPLEGNQDDTPSWVVLPNTTDWPVRLGASGYRLPTEAEWEVACRAGTVTSYSFGGDAALLAHYGWYLDNSNRWSRTVGLVRPNPRGLSDIHGNVFEWCHDWYAATVPAESVDPVGAERGSLRVYRGGSWDRGPLHCRSAYRDGFTPEGRSSYLGFRPARSSVE